MQSPVKTRNILFIGPVFPEPTSSAAGVRTASLLEDFRSRGDRILFAAASDQNEFGADLRARGIETVVIGPNDPEFDRTVTEFAPDVVLFDRFMLEEQFGWRVSEAAPNALKILDTIDLHFLRRVRAEWLKEALSGKKEGSTISDADFLRISESTLEIETPDCLREIASLYRCDLTLILSRFEMHLLRDRFRFDESMLLYLGFSYPEPDSKAWLPFPGRKHFASIGNFRHLPNRDATFWLAHDLWPRIRAELARRGEADVELHLFGAYPPKEVMALDSPKTGFRVFGPVDESIPTLRKYRACLAPIRFGAGIKGKIADAWSAGIPVVTTPLGAEGMETPRGPGFSGEFAGMVGRTPEEFVRLAVETYSDATASDRLTDFGGRALMTNYSETENRTIFLERIDALLDSPEFLKAHRQKNIVGRILHQESHGRTKYLSKWIEEKNQKGSPK